jgi:hypothetical protein
MQCENLRVSFSSASHWTFFEQAVMVVEAVLNIVGEVIVVTHLKAVTVGCYYNPNTK